VFITHSADVSRKKTKPSAEETKPSTIETVRNGSVTVKIYRVERPGRTVWTVAHYFEGRRRTFQSTDQAKAKAEAKRIASQMAQGQTVAMSLSNAEAAVYGMARKALERTGKRLDVAAEEYAHAWDILNGVSILEAAREYRKRNEGVNPMLVSDVYAAFLEARGKRSAAYLKDISQRLGRFKERFGGYIGNITAADLRAWLAGMECGDRTRENFRCLIVTLFRFAQKQKWLPPGPTEAENVEAFEDEAAGEIQIFTPEEMRKLLDAATPEVLPYLVLGAFAGIRTAEICRMEWGNILFTRKLIRVEGRKAKTRQRRHIPILPCLESWLAPYVGREGPVVNLARPEKHAGEVTADVAGVKWKRNGLRHSFVSYRMAAIQNENQVAAEAGNSPAMIYQNYRELVGPDDAAAWFSIVQTGKAVGEVSDGPKS
jgi:integrase